MSKWREKLYSPQHSKVNYRAATSMSPNPSLQLPPPDNWQDFEKLCWDLWKEIWRDPNTQRHGRQGQAQHGVDVYGRPDRGRVFAGVQCKGKDSYADKTATVTELLDEVEKAKGFEPPLSEFLFVTSGPKDAQVEEEARKLTAKHAEQGLFAVVAFGWRDVVERLETYPDVLERYYPGMSGTLAGVKEVVDDLMGATKQVLTDTGEIKQALAAGQAFANVLPATALDTTEVLESEHQAELDHARDLLNDNNPRQAKDYLEKLRERIWSICKPEAKYRILANLAFADLRLGDLATAGSLFVEAFQYSNEDDKALSNLALGHALLGEAQEAEAAARRAIEKNPQSVDAYCALLQSQQQLPIEQIIDLVPASLQDKLEVAYTIGALAQKKELVETAEAWFRRALASDEGRTDIKGTLASTIIQQVLNDRKLVPEQLTPQNREALETAIAYLDEAWEGIKEKDARFCSAEWLVNRALAKSLLDDNDGAAKDLDAAMDLAPDVPFFIKNRGIVAHYAGDDEKAMACFEQIKDCPDVPDAPLFIAQILRQRGEAVEAMAVLRDLIQKTADPVLSKEAKHGVLSLHIAAGEFDDARSLNEQMIGEDPSDIPNRIDAVRIEKAAGENQLAVDYAKEAVKCITEDTKRLNIVFLANELFDLKEYSGAASLYAGIADTSSDNALSRQLINSYYAAGLYDKCLEACMAVLNATGPVKYISQMVSTIYELIGDLPNAIGVCEEYLASDSGDFDMRLRLALIHMRQGDDAAVDEFLASSTVPDDIPVETAFYLAALYSARGNPEDAVDILYELRRRHFDNPDVHLKYVGTFFGRDKSSDSWLDFDTVAAGCAVGIRDAQQQVRWYVLDDREDADIAKGEIRSNHNLWKELQGKKVGDTVVLSESPVEKCSGEVVDVVSKYVHAMRQSMDQFETLFPGQPGLWKVSFDTSKPKESIDKILSLTKERSDQVSQMEQAYSQGPMPIGMFAQLTGKTPFEALGYLSSRSELGVKCCVGAKDERERALAILSEKEWRLVTDITGLVALRELDILESVKERFGAIGLSQSTVDMLHGLQGERALQTGGFLSLGFEGSQAVRSEVTPEDVTKALEELKTFDKVIDAFCEVVPCTGALEVSSAQKSEYDKLLGSSFVDTMLIAGTEGRLLYTDDMAFRGLSNNEQGIPGVWTQVLLMGMQETGHLSREAYHKAAIRLVLFNYRHTSINGDILVEAARESGWLPTEQFKKVVSVLSGGMSDEGSTAVVAANFVFQLWKEKVIATNRDHLILALLDAITTRRDVDSILKALLRQVKAHFVLAPTVEAEFVRLVEAWRKVNLT